MIGLLKYEIRDIKVNWLPLSLRVSSINQTDSSVSIIHRPNPKLTITSRSMFITKR